MRREILDRGLTVAAVLSWVTFAVLAIVIAGEWRRGLDADYVCQQLWHPLPADVIGEAGTGAWSWWPIGITCSFPTEQGGRFVLAPDPSTSAVLIAAAVTACIGIALAVTRVALRAATSSRSRRAASGPR